MVQHVDHAHGVEVSIVERDTHAVVDAKVDARVVAVDHVDAEWLHVLLAGERGRRVAIAAAHIQQSAAPWKVFTHQRVSIVIRSVRVARVQVGCVTAVERRA